jgi:hypothetical protein
MLLPFRYDSDYTSLSPQAAKTKTTKGYWRAKMGQSNGAVYLHISDPLFTVLKTEFNDSPEVYNLFDEFFQHKAYDRAYALKLLEKSKARETTSWNIRRLAALMLEHQMVNLPVDRIQEFDFFFARLKIKATEGIGSRVNDFVLKEGYSTTELGDFILEFRRKLKKQNRVHSLIQGERTSESALREFIHLSRHECNLSLARYLWTPQEVVERILKQVRLSRGIKDTRPMLHPYMESEAERTLSAVPDFEAEILRRLRSMSKIFWVSDSTNSELNSLVEYPLTTVVLVIKPPGSDLEFELKRAGDRGEHPLDVFYTRGEEPVPVTHRLHAGSMGEYLRWEAGAAAILSRIYGLVHGTEAPIARTISVSTIYTIPRKDGEEHILRYFTDARSFGDGFRRMRDAMAESIAAFQRERNWVPPRVGGDLGLTAQFLSLVAPGQAILVGTTSYRLDRLARYLSPDGPQRYFTDGLGVEYSYLDAKRFVDEILDEVLGIYVPPKVTYHDPEQYITEAFSVPENRRRANYNYLSVMRQIGKFWGTLLAFKGFTRGESFVARNAGLKSVWESGQWIVKIIFMDHDDLDIAGKNSREFHPRAVFPAIADDELHIFGGIYCGETIKGEVEFLQEIYRIGEDVCEEGATAIRQALRYAYKHTQKELVNNPQFRACFHESFIEQILDCDAIVARYLEARLDRAAIDSWKEETEGFLSSKGYKDWMINDYFCAVDSFDDFLAKYSFLY